MDVSTYKAYCYCNWAYGPGCKALLESAWIWTIVPIINIQCSISTDYQVGPPNIEVPNKFTIDYNKVMLALLVVESEYKLANSLVVKNVKIIIFVALLNK